MKETTATGGRAECPPAPHRGTAQRPGQRAAPGLFPRRADLRRLLRHRRLPHPGRSHSQRPAVSGGLLQRVGGGAGGKAARPSSAPRSRPCCCPTSCLRAPSPATRPRAWPRWRAGRSFRWKMCWPSLQAGPLLAIAGVQDPGNLGTILRSAEAFGAGGVLLGEGTVSPFNPKVVRASAGSVFRLPVARAKLSEALDRP